MASLYTIYFFMGYINDFLAICNYYVNNAIIYKWSLTNIKIMIIKKIFQENYFLFFINYYLGYSP